MTGYYTNIEYDLANAVISFLVFPAIIINIEFKRFSILVSELSI